MTKIFSVCALVILVPLASLRMICVDHDVAPAGRTVASAATCDEICPRDAAPRPTDGAAAGCLLVAGGCSALASFAIALPVPTGLRLTPPAMTIARAAVSRPGHVSPDIEPFNPPPEDANS